MAAGKSAWPLERVLLTGSCPASLVLRRGCRLRSAIYDHSDRADVRAEEVTV